MQYAELVAIREQVNHLKYNENINSIINSVDKIDLSEDDQKEVLLFIKKHIPTIFTQNDKLNVLNNLLWNFLLINKNASEELRLTTEKNNGSRFKQGILDQNLCCMESFEQRIKENGKFKNLEEYTNEMYKKYGVDVIEYCEYDSMIQIMKEKNLKYIEKHQEEEPDNYLKKMEYAEEENFNSFFKRKLIYRSYTDRPLLAMLSQRSIYLELNPLELLDNIKKLIGALLKDELVENRTKFMCKMIKDYKTDVLANDGIYEEELIDTSGKNLISHFEDIQKIVKRRTAIVEIFQCLLCYLLMSDYGITKYTKAVNAMNYLMMRLYNEDDQFSLTTLNKVLIHSESTIAERRKLTKTIKKTLSLEKIKP